MEQQPANWNDNRQRANTHGCISASSVFHHLEGATPTTKGRPQKKEENYKENVGEDKTKTKTGRATVTICCGILTILPFNVAQAEARGDVDVVGRKMLLYVVHVYGDWADVAYA